MTEKLNLNCGNCAWYMEITIPEEKKEVLSPRGYCHAVPPSVFPLPKQQQSSLALAQGQQAPGQVTMLPLMMRPVVESTEAICGSYQPNQEARLMLAEVEKGCDGCVNCDGSCQEGECNCGS